MSEADNDGVFQLVKEYFDSLQIELQEEGKDSHLTDVN